MQRHSEIGDRLWILIVVFLVLSAASGGAAQDNGYPELATFDAVLDQDRSLAIDLTAHPALMQSAGFLKVHQDLGKYFKDHPEVLTELSSDPNLLIVRERRFLAAGVDKVDTHGNRVKRVSIDWLDAYLVTHSDLHQALRREPDLIDSPETINKFPELAQLFKSDLAFSQQFKLHPGAYLNQ